MPDVHGQDAARERERRDRLDPRRFGHLFKHALIRDAAYEALLKSRRKDLHRRVASKITEKFPSLKDARPEVLARHWTAAGETEPAIAEWSRAGNTAEARNAFREARESYQQGLALLEQLPESTGRDLSELELRQAVIRMLWVTGWYSTPETIEATERAAMVAERSGNLAQLVYWLVLGGFTTIFSGDLAAAGALADQALELAVREGSPLSLGSAHNLEVQTRCFRGDLIGAEEHFTAGTDAPNPGTAYGSSMHRELELLVNAGLSAIEALAATTSVPARICGLRDRGRVAPGMCADLLLVEGNPAGDVTDTRNIVAVWKKGVLIKRRARSRNDTPQHDPN